MSARGRIAGRARRQSSTVTTVITRRTVALLNLDNPSRSAAPFVSADPQTDTLNDALDRPQKDAGTMIRPKKPLPGSERIAALKRGEGVDTLSEDAYDDLLTIIAGTCGAPMGAISLIDDGPAVIY